MKIKNITAMVLAAACLTALSAGAQETNPSPDTAGDAPMQTVLLHGVRDPALAPYENVYDTLTKIRKISDGKVDVLFRILSAQSLQPIPDLEVSLEGDTTYEKLKVSPDGFLTVPLNEKYRIDKAVFLTNKKKGSVRGEQYVVPKLPKENLKYGDIAASITAGRRAIDEVLPWYQRLLVGKIHEVQLCYPDNKQKIVINDNASSTRPAINERKNVLTKETVYCATFNEGETEAAKETLVTPPEGWVALFH